MLFTFFVASSLSTNTLRTNADGDLEVDIASGKAMVFSCPRAPRGGELACSGDGVRAVDGICQPAEPCRGTGVRWTGTTCEPIAASQPTGTTPDQLLTIFADKNVSRVHVHVDHSEKMKIAANDEGTKQNRVSNH